MTVELSCGLPPGPDFSDQAVLAESLGYSRVWIFGSAPLWEDPFDHLALAAERTTRIGLGTAVLVPHERSEMAMASAIATIARPPMADSGRASEPAQPRAATEIADGIIVGLPMAHALLIAMLMPATVLEPGEGRDNRRVREAIGPRQVVSYHEAYFVAGPDAVDTMPGGRAWRDAVAVLAPEGERHLFTHQGHVTTLTERDHQLLDHAPDGLATIGAPVEIADRVAELGRQGVHEVIYTPSGPDVARELKTFYAAAAPR